LYLEGPGLELACSAPQIASRRDGRCWVNNTVRPPNRSETTNPSCDTTIVFGINTAEFGLLNLPSLTCVWTVETNNRIVREFTRGAAAPPPRSAPCLAITDSVRTHSIRLRLALVYAWYDYVAPVFPPALRPGALSLPCRILPESYLLHSAALRSHLSPSLHIPRRPRILSLNTTIATAIAQRAPCAKPVY
jgi:hypothetical protein